MPTTVKQTLTGPQFAAITDFTDLWLEFKANSYQGPGDVVSGAAGWWGLRAYMVASIGSNAIRLRRDSDQAESDFVTVSGGGLDLAGIASFKSAANLFVTKLYDQSGAGNHLIQATAANQPKFILSGLGSFPVMRFVNADQRYLKTPGTSPISSQPFTFSMAFSQNFTASSDRRMLCDGFDGSICILNDNQGNNANTLSFFAGVISATVPCTDSTWHAMQAIFNTVSSSAYIDGSSTAFSPSVGASPGGITLGHPTAPALSYDGDLVEVGVWFSALSGANQSALNNNQHTFLGF